MRIGIDGRLWNETGVGRYIRNLVSELQVIDKENQYTVFISSKEYRKISSEYSSPNFEFRSTDIHWHSVSEQITFPQVLLKENLDLMHFTYFSLPILYPKPFVVTIHDLIINHFPTGKASTLPYPLYQVKRIGYQIALHSAVSKSKKIIVPLTAVKDDLHKTMHVSNDKIVVTKEGVDLSSLRRVKGDEAISHKRSPRSALDDEYFLYVGNAYPHKNVERLIEAFILFQKEQPDVDLFLVGKDDYFYQALEAKFTKDAYPHIHFKHNVSDNELFTLYSHAKAFISPSLMEGFGLPPLEAMSVSCPVLVSDIPAFREVCGDAAYYFNPYDIRDLVHKMSFMYNLTQKEKAVRSAHGRERVQQFSWKRMAQETKAVYESSLSV
jgi:glycosyltransferase involved in cell wall biosynthesis